MGEISTALEDSFGRHAATSDVVSGVYRRRPGRQRGRRRVAGLTAAFAQDAGRKPRILVAKVGQDGHDRGQKVIASAFSDLGFDVRVGPLFATPAEVADRAIAERRARARGVVAGRRPPDPRARDPGRARREGAVRHPPGARRRDPARRPRCREAGGVAAVFPPGTVVTEAAETLLAMLNDRLGFAQKDPSAYLADHLQTS